MFVGICLRKKCGQYRGMSMEQKEVLVLWQNRRYKGRLHMHRHRVTE